MPQRYTGRFTLIAVVLIVFLYAIFPIGTSSPKPNLKPGIDMAGGTSLTYEIKPPAGASVSSDLAVQVMESLKKRVDPNGVRNLIWRPQGADRLEIQMPSSGKEAQAEAIRGRFLQIQRRLEETNIRPADVIYVIENLKGDARRDRLNQLAMGSLTREKLFGALASVYDGRQQARAAKNVEVDVQKDKEYESLKAQLDATNLTVPALEEILELKPATREQRLAELKSRYADFPARLNALNDFVSGYTEFKQVKESIGSAADLKRMLKGSGVLEFHILAGNDLPPDQYNAMRERLHKSGPGVKANDTTRWYQVQRPDQLRGRITETYNDKQWVLAWITQERQLVNGPGIERWALEGARPEVDSTGRNIVGFFFDPQGAKYFAQLTGSNLQKPLAIMLDDKVISAPTIQSQIGKDGTITGDYSPEELRYLISTLNAGSLPAQLADEPISERTVGPQLGEDNLRAGLVSCIFGLLAVCIFLVSYYYLAGVVAFLAVFMNVVLILGSLAAFNATFTLPGVAGIVLTIGAAVDANVLIFERLREEQHRGLSLRMAMRNAYDRAASAILDSNATTLITSLVLYLLGSEEVKGFGLTLLIGLIWSLFTSLFVTKTIFGYMIDHWGIDHLGSLPLTFPKWDKLLKPNIDWMGRIKWMCMSMSAALIIGGMASFYLKAKHGELLDIEFASGTQIQFELKDEFRNMSRADVQVLIDKYPQQLPAASVYTVGKPGSGEFEVVTPNAKPVEVKTAVLEAIGPRLKLERPSNFEMTNSPIQEVVDKGIIIPIQSTDQSIGGFTPPSLPRYVGGAAIVLRNLDPPLSAAVIKDRIARQRLQPDAGKAPTDFTVEAPGGAETPSNFAVVLVADPAIAYGDDPDKWRDEVAGPMWKLINDAINKPAQLQKVSNFSPAVAGDMTRDAMIALALSVMAIMAYIWIRFGNLKYGTATVLAMLHDTLLVVGAIGLAHYLALTPVGRWLLVEPFRINLTMVAAVLTVMSYSMIDTIVVFDRVREIRGKYGILSRQVINDAINQTLSRTLLTVGTTVATVAIMYITGGPGIHGFTFVLLVGILVGSYSSIAIAAPILLIGSARAAPAAPPRALQPVQGVGR